VVRSLRHDDRLWCRDWSTWCDEPVRVTAAPSGERPDKDIEILALRHQITVLERQLGGTRPRFSSANRAFLAALLHRLPWHVLGRFQLLVRPDTVLHLCVPRTSSTSCDQAIFVDHAIDASVSSDTVLLKIDRFG
jgi:hypothetical protein